MYKLYELLAKVGTNPKLRAWAMEQLIKLKHLKKGYKKSYFHRMDLDKVKDIKNPNWLMEKIANAKTYNLKDKVVDITKAKDKLKWDKIQKTQDKDKFYGVTGQVNTWLKKIKDEGIAWEAKIAKDDAWFNKLIKAEIKGDIRAKKILNDYFKKQEKIIPFKPKKAEGGRIGFDDGGPSQKEIDKGLKAIEKLKSSLMPESYEELIKIYKDKQKEVDIDIMEDAGGLGEMLGEGGRIGMMYGGDPGFAFSYGGSWADWKENHASEMPVMDYINQKLPKARNPFSDAKYQDGGSVDPKIIKDLIADYMELGMTQEQAEKQAQASIQQVQSKAEGGRIGMAGGMSAKRIESKKRELYYKFNRDGYLSMREYLDGGQSDRDLEGDFKKGGRVGFKKGSKKGGIGDLLGEMYRLFEIGPLLGSPELMNIIQSLPFEKGGRVGFKKGDKVDLDRRMILKGIGALAALPAFKWLKFAKTKPVKDISVKLKSWIDDSDEMTEWGPQAVGRWAGNFDISSLTPKGIVILKKLFGKSVKTVKDKSGKVTASVDDVATDDAVGYVDDIIKKGKGSIDFKYLDDTGGALGSVEGTLAHYAKTFGKNSKLYKDLLKKSKKMTEKQKIQYELADEYQGSVDQTGAVDEVLELIYPGKGEGGSVGWPPVQFNPKEQPPVQGPPYETNNPNEAFKEILRQSIGSGIASGNLGGGFSQGIGYGEDKPFDYGIGYNIDPQSSGWSASYGINQGGNDVMSGAYNSPGGTFSMGVNKQEGSDPQFKFQKKWKFAKGGKAWQPKSAPKLTTTIPPERGPTPQGLTYLTGDDIVQNIGHKHGRN